MPKLTKQQLKNKERGMRAAETRKRNKLNQQKNAEPLSIDLPLHKSADTQSIDDGMNSLHLHNTIGVKAHSSIVEPISYSVPTILGRIIEIEESVKSLHQYIDGLYEERNKDRKEFREAMIKIGL